MNYLKIYLSVLVLFTALFYSCTKETVVEPGGTVNFSRDISPIFLKNCAASGCHNSFDRKSGLDVTSWNALVKEGSDFGNEIIPYNSFWSHLVWHINTDTNVAPVTEPHMPPAHPPYTNNTSLTKGEVALIMKWIDEGAKNDQGEIAWSDIRRKAFVTNQSVDLVAVVNLDDFRLTRLINVGSRGNTSFPPDAPHVIIADKQKKYFYVTLVAEGYIEKFDAVTYEKTGRINGGNSPAHVVISNDGSTGYFTNFDLTYSETTVKKFDTGTMTLLDTVSSTILKAPHGLAISHDDQFLVAAGSVSEYLVKIKTSDFSIETSTPVDETVPPSGNGTNNFRPYQVVITNDNRYAMVSLSKSNQVRVYDLQNFMNLVTVINTGQYPLALEISPDGNICYVPNQLSNSVTVIDVNTFQVIKTINDIGVQPHMVDFTTEGRYALVTCESRTGSFIHHALQSSKRPGTTAVIDLSMGHIKVKDIEMASFPAGISILD